MKLVIDIPDQYYTIIQNSTEYIDEVARVCEDSVKNGIPLPEGYGRLIDADKLKEVYETTEDAEYCQWTLYGVISEIDDAETIVEAEGGVKE